MHLYILDCSIQAVLARMLRELMNQVWPTEELESLRARAGLETAESLNPGHSGQDSAGAMKSALAATKV